MKPIDRDPSYYEPCFRIQQAVSGVDIDGEFFLSDIAPNVSNTSHRNYHARRMPCLTETGIKGQLGQPQFRKISDPRLLIETVFTDVGENPSALVLRRELPFTPKDCFDCQRPFNTCLILRAYQLEVNRRIQALEAK